MERSGSKLMQMQARFQQKQMQEREMKIASLYEAQQARALERVRHSPAESLASPPPAQHGPGKVRQMFEERRTKGIDKSYPLQPIHNTDRTRKPLPNGFTKVTSTRVVENGNRTSTRVIENGSKVSTRVEAGTKVSSNRITENGNKVTNTRVVENGKHSHVTMEKRTSKQSQVNSNSVKRHQMKTETEVNGSGDLNHNHQPDLNAVKQMMLQSGDELVGGLDAPGAGRGYRLEDETFPEALAPAASPREPERQPERPPRRNPAAKVSPPKTRPAPAPAAPPRRAHSDNAVAEPRAPGAMQRSTNPAPISRKFPTTSVSKSRTGSISGGSSGAGVGAGAGAGSGASGGGGGAPGAACAVCGRHFAPDRLSKHQDICRKAKAKKRKPFDALKHRLAGTEAEPFLAKLRKAPAARAPALNAGWRQQHDEFIRAIRAAKQVQLHLAAGGKLSDLPPPPPSENPDYVACPHCGRRFNQAAAERHIPKCATFQFNKPKPAASRRR